MPYTVVLPGGTSNYDFEAYVRVMDQLGVDWADTPRALEPETAARYLPIWERRADAERFAEALRQHAEQKGWRVVEVPPERISRGGLGPVEIKVGRQSDGFVYGLHPNSRRLIERAFPQAHLLRSVFVGTKPHEDFDTSQWQVIDQVARILTGLTPEQLEQLGGIRLYDPARDEVLRPGTRLACWRAWRRPT
jgi:hypothetical protein